MARMTPPLRLIQQMDPSLPVPLLIDRTFEKRWPAPIQLTYYVAVSLARSAAQLETAYWMRQCQDAELERLATEVHQLWKQLEHYAARQLEARVVP